MTSILLVPTPDLVYFKSINQGNYDKVYGLTNATVGTLKTKLERSKIVAVDIETTHREPGYGQLVLSTWYFPEIQYVITIVHFQTTFDQGLFRVLAPAWRNTTVISHNAAFEYRWLMQTVPQRNRFGEVWCTMVADQKITQGMEGFRYNIVDTLNRRSVKHSIKKDVRDTFSGITKPSDLDIDHLIYNRDDTIPLYELYQKQTFLVRTLNQEFWIRHIHMKLVMILADMENEGLVLNVDKWIQQVEQAEKDLHDLDQALHSWVYSKTSQPIETLVPALNNTVEKYHTQLNNLKDRIKKNRDLLRKLESQNKQHLKSYQTTLGVLARAVQAYGDLEPPQTRINWDSSDQVLDLMKALKMPLPVGKSATTHKFQPSISKAARQNWLINNAQHPDKDFMVLLGKYSEKAKRLNSFGRGFIEKYLRDNGKVHTSYKQGTVATGRLASGSANSIPATFNSQQLPADIDVRECFGTDPDYLIATCDLSGAELITMCSLAQDKRLLELSKGDMHSYFANKGWKAIYDHRGIPWTDADVISSTQNKNKRTAYKSMTFGTVYGLKPPKAGETLNVSAEEGKIAIDTIIDEIPDTIAMVEGASRHALQHGWVLHNTRTNSRRWFRPVLELNMRNQSLPPENCFSLPPRHENTISQAARNTRVQGTQADMLTEAMVLLDRYIRLNKLDAKLLLQVHDEIVVKFHKDYKDWFPGKLKEIMIRTANKYLKNVTMDADCKVGLTWTK